MSLQVNLKLKLVRIPKTICVKYNTYEKATYDQYLVASIALRTHRDQKVAEKYIDEITGAGSLNGHFKSLYQSVSKFTEEQLQNIMSNSMFPVLKVDKNNSYLYYPQINISVFRNKVYSGDFGEYSNVCDYLMIHEEIIEKNVECKKEISTPDPYFVLIEENKIQVKIADSFNEISQEEFRELLVNELVGLGKYDGMIHKNVIGDNWKILTNAAIGNMFSNNNYYYDVDGNHCQIRHENVRKTMIAQIAGLYIFKEEIMQYNSNKEMCEKVVQILFENNAINEFKTKALLVILHNVEDISAQQVINYILSRKESKEISLLGIEMLKKGLEKGWNDETLISFAKYADSSMFNLIYKANPMLVNDVEQLIHIDFDLLTESHKQSVKELYESKQKKMKAIETILGEVAASGIRERIKKLKADDDTRRATKLMNDLMAHAQKGLDEMSMLQLDNKLAQAKELHDLKKKLENRVVEEVKK